MRKLLAFLVLFSTLANAEVDRRAMDRIDDIRKGRANGNAIEDLYVTDDGIIRDDLTVLGSEIVGGNLSVSGTVTTTGATTQNGNLDVNGNGEFNSIVVRTNATIGGTITSGTHSVLGNLSVTNNTTTRDLVVQALASMQNVDATTSFRSLGSTILGDAITDTTIISGPVLASNSVTIGNSALVTWFSNNCLTVDGSTQMTVTNTQVLAGNWPIYYLTGTGASNILTIANPTGGRGQSLRIINDSTTTISFADSGNLRLNGAFNGDSQDTLDLLGGAPGNTWVEMGRSQN